MNSLITKIKALLPYQVSQLLSDKKNLMSLLVLGILILGIPLGVNLLKYQQIIKSRATNPPIVFKGDNVRQLAGGQWVVVDASKEISMELTSPLGPPGASPSASPSPTPSPSPTSPPNYGTKIIAYEAFNFTIGSQQKITQSMITDNGTTFTRTCNVGATDVDWSGCNASGWNQTTMSAPDGSGAKIISYGAFTFTVGTQQKVTQSLLADNGKTFARTCNVGATDVDWSGCNASGWQTSTLSIPGNIRQ